jgi:hypothetical protein
LGVLHTQPSAQPTQLAGTPDARERCGREREGEREGGRERDRERGKEREGAAAAQGEANRAQPRVLRRRVLRVE